MPGWVSKMNLEFPFPTMGSLELSNSAEQLQGETGRSTLSLPKGEGSQHFHSSSVPSQGVDSNLTIFFQIWPTDWLFFMQPPWSVSRISIPEILWSRTPNHSIHIPALSWPGITPGTTQLCFPQLKYKDFWLNQEYSANQAVFLLFFLQIHFLLSQESLL